MTRQNIDPRLAPTVLHDAIERVAKLVADHIAICDRDRDERRITRENDRTEGFKRYDRLMEVLNTTKIAALVSLASVLLAALGVTVIKALGW